jgi:hypothetical protein
MFLRLHLHLLVAFLPVSFFSLVLSLPQLLLHSFHDINHLLLSITGITSSGHPSHFFLQHIPRT